MVDLAREAFSTNNFGLAADIYERTIVETGPTSELFLGLADSYARCGLFTKAFNAYTNAYRYGKVTPEKLNNLVVGLINTVKQDISNNSCGSLVEVKKNCCCMFTCGVCKGLLAEPVTLPCGHTFCRKCLEKDKTKTCCVCNVVHYRLKLRNLSSNVVLTNLIQKLFPNECQAALFKKEGNGYFERREFQNAIKFYSQAIEIAPQDHLLRSNRCHAYASLDMFAEALEDAEQVVQLRPDWAKGYFRKATALYGLAKYEDAALGFLQCLSLDQKVSSAKDYLSKALDKILSALPPDDPKAQARLQQANPSLLHQLIEGNFNLPILPPDLSHTLAEIMEETIETANNFSQEPTPLVEASHAQEKQRIEEKEKNCFEEIGSVFERKLRCNSLPNCSEVNYDEIQQVTRPRTHSPLPSPPPSRKRHFSPTVSLPHKFPKSSKKQLGQEPVSSAEAENHNVKPGALVVDDLECGLCYRLFFEPVTTPCGHTFCRKCLDRCLDHTVACPMCKGNLSEYLAERRQAVTEAVQCIIDAYFKHESQERSIMNDEEMLELAKMGSNQQSEIPVFVCTLSFPTISCPLHIFEPRYRLMVRQCMESGTRQFGMCMPTDDDDEFTDYGCMLEIRDMQFFPDGRSVVDSVGGRRFKVIGRGKRDGYNTAKVEFITDKPIDAEELQDVLRLQTELHGRMSQWLQRLPAEHRQRITQHFGELPALEQNPACSHSGPAWAWWAVSVLPLDPRVQMTLLAMSSYKERLEAIVKVMDYLGRRGSR